MRISNPTKKGEFMGLIKGFVREHWRILFVGLFFGVLLQGCQTPLVDVNVALSDTPVCPDDGDGKTQVGACRPPMYYSDSAAGFWHDGNGWLPPTTPIMCKPGSTKCKSYAGICQGQSCISRIKNVSNNQGDCYCGCIP